MAFSRTSNLFAALIFLLAATTSWGQGFRKVYDIPQSKFNDVVETIDGSFFLAGSSETQPAWFQLTDHIGNPIWSFGYDLGGAEAVAACQVNDGGFVVLTEYFNDQGDFKNLVVKISPAGTLQWQTLVTNINMENGSADLVSSSDGGAMLVGNVRPNFYNQDVQLQKINADGSLGWTTTLGAPNADEFAVRLLADADGGFTVGGWGTYGAAGEGISDFFLAKTNANGALQWLKSYPKPATQLAYDLIRTNDGGLALLGESQQTDPIQITLLKTNAAGAEQWYKQFHPRPQGSDLSPLLLFNSLAEDHAGQLYIPISLYELDVKTDSSFLAIFSPNGQLDALKAYNSEDRTIQIIQTHDNKLALTGCVGAFPSPTQRAFLSRVDLTGDLYGNKLTGTLYHDLNDNCTKEANEPMLPNFSVRAANAAGDVFFTQTDATGSYSMFVSEGDFSLTAKPLFGAEEIWSPCDTPTVPVTGLNTTFFAPDIGIRSLTSCPQLNVEMGAGLLRRCFTTRFTAQYCNTGTATATDAYVVLTMDPLLEYQSSSLPLASQNGQELRFELGNLAAGDCGTLTADFKVACNTPLGSVLCTEAQVFPDSLCPPVGSQPWDGSHIAVQGACDGAVRFKVRNNGASNMSESVDYVIIEDLIMVMKGKIQLDAGKDSTLVVPGTPNGKSYYLRMDQAKGYPANSSPSATVQGCGGSGGENLLMQLPQNQGEPTRAIYCDQAIGSFDPNDKRGFPLGWKEEHYIERNQELEYMIRFQNTGNDTAFLVVVRDSLSHLLDASTVRPGASSHPYTFDLSDDGVLTFRFKDILLPDSNVNEPASHGYVQFRVQQQKDLPLGSRLENRAGIFFDFNEAVITNTAFHTIGERLLTFSVDRPSDLIGLRITPNPVADDAIFQLQKPLPGADLHLSLFDATGHIVRDEMFAQPEHRFQRRGLLPGMYFFRIQQNGKTVASGKVMVQ